MKRNIRKMFAGLAVLFSVSCSNESMEPDDSIDNKVGPRPFLSVFLQRCRLMTMSQKWDIHVRKDYMEGKGLPVRDCRYLD